MNKHSHTFFIVLVTLYLVAGEERTKYEIKNNKKLKATFNKLLQTVTSVNEERLDALKTFYELQNYLPKVGRTNEKIVALIIPKNNIDSKREGTDNTEDVYNKGPNIEPEDTPPDLKVLEDKETNNQKNLSNENLKMVVSEEDLEVANKSGLREWKGCNKSAAKYCRKACKNAFREICEDYKCSKSMKKKSKKSCKRMCNAQFSYDDEDYSE